MSNMPDLGYVLTGLAAGAAAHKLYFQQYEYHRHLKALLVIAFMTPFVLLLVYIRNFDLAYLRALSATTWTLTGFINGAIGSTLVYRLFFHPLNRFPGPYSARLTDFWIAITVGNDLKQYRKLEQLHKKYGKIVRTGANRLSIVEPQIFQLAFSANNAVATKGPWYDVNYPIPALSEERDRKSHDARRRHWVPAFSDKALRAYEVHLHGSCDKFMRRIDEFHGGPVNIAKWFHLFSFEFMGKMSFGKDYGMLDSGEKHETLSILTEAMAPLGLTIPPWFTLLVKKLPIDSLGLKRFIKFAKAELAEMVKRIKQDDKAMTGDTITSWLYQIYAHEAHPEQSPLFLRDAILLIIAGSDTTAGSLTYLFWLLSQHPQHIRKIREEVEPLTHGAWSDKDIRHCEHLNACINEQLRLHNPSPTGIYRYTPPEGMQLDNTYIPGQVEFNVPTYIANRDETIYAQAESYIPERWTTRPELVLNKSCHYPFLAGSYGCLGKNLALMEMRVMTVKLLLKYDVKLVEGENGHRLLWESKDHLTMSLAPLDLVFTERKV